MKKRGRQTGKERFTIHASLCGRGDLLKALGSVASYLADRLFNLSNDKDLGGSPAKLVQDELIFSMNYREHAKLSFLSQEYETQT